MRAVSLRLAAAPVLFARCLMHLLHRSSPMNPFR
jgi:hypothetical protein